MGFGLEPLVNSKEPSGPLTAAFGDLVQTPKGLRSYTLEGFSEDLDQDGFVDPVGQAVAPVVHHAPVITYAAPVVTAPAVVPAATVKTIAAPGFAYGFGHGFGYGLGYPWGLPLVAAAPAAAAADEAPAVEEARKKRDADADPALLYGGVHGFGYGVGAYGAYPYHAGVVAAPAAVAVEAAAPVAVAAPAVVGHAISYSHVPTVQHVQYTVAKPITTVQKHVTTHTTHHVINHAPVVSGVIGGLVHPLHAGLAAAPAVEDAAVVEAAKKNHKVTSHMLAK